jgi:hypothetical protein
MRTPQLAIDKQAVRMRLPDGSRSAESPWVWRGFLFMSLIALGLCLTLLAGHRVVFAGAWALITIAWFTTSMWLWRKHIEAARAPLAASTSSGRGGRR